MQLPRGCSRLAAGSAAPGGHRGAAPVLAALLGLGAVLAYGERRRRVSDTGVVAPGGAVTARGPAPARGHRGWGWIPEGADPDER